VLNPITFTEKIVGDFLKYQFTTYQLADRDLNAQMRKLLSLEETRATPLMRGPYISLSRSFRKGAKVSDLISEGLLHAHMASLVPFPNVYGHQETAIREIAKRQSTLVSTGTGSGKTECFLYPIISRCLKLRDENADEGIVAVIVYPMNALAEDQLGRLRELLTGTGISFGMYVGKTPENQADVSGVILPPGSSRADYQAKLKQLRDQKDSKAVHPPEERTSREEMRTPGKQPRILLTNVKQLELLLTRHRDVELFEKARLDFLVFDEAHTFSGAAGAETACLIRRLRAFCGKGPKDTVCVATSATIADPIKGPDAGRAFASRFFGIETADVSLIGEEYEEETWASTRTPSAPLPGDPVIQLQTVLDAIFELEQVPTPKEAVKMLRGVFQAMTGASLDPAKWQQSLYEWLAANETVYQIAEALKEPCALFDLVEELSKQLGRPVPVEEILTWLALGAASRSDDDRPLLRPVVHCFVRGVSGAVVTFPPEEPRPRLWLSAEDATEQDGNLFKLQATTCTTCGQHYFVHFVKDFDLSGKTPGGGEAKEDRFYWPPLDQTLNGNRVVLLDRLALGEDDDEDEETPRKSAPVFFCRYCGTLHPKKIDRCDGCGREGELVSLFAVWQNKDNPGYLTTCIACGSLGRRYLGTYREPARPIRALTVSDVHVLAQSMIQHAIRKRLLVFADNRQDAAFQAGWMQDHARRFRLRSLMFEQIEKGPISIGDLTAHLDRLLDLDDDLSAALIPEVWRVARKEATGLEHARERKRFLRIQILRELTTGARQRIGLEPWGRIKVEYTGLDSSLDFFQTWATEAGCTPDELLEGVAALLDVARRNRVLLDREDQVFSKIWFEGDREIQYGYLPMFKGGPKGLKLRYGANDERSRIMQWLGQRAGTAARQAAKGWGIPDDKVVEFFEELWNLLTDDLKLLSGVTLVGRRNNALPGCADVKQIDADRILIHANKGVYRCDVCRRPNVRKSPQSACMVFRCDGTLRFEDEDQDNYDLMVLDQQFSMIRPREHSAQIPSTDREIIERMFKGDGERLNALVCTPTLELGVDIGALDSVLMRNVPPLPANYWQRAGRAGRRHRMAVNMTYARPASHDRAYFVDPMKMLNGKILPPSFNLRNGVMIQKHVHATVLTALYGLAKSGSSLPESEKTELTASLDHCFPTQIKDYLFDESGNVRSDLFDLTLFAKVIVKYRAHILDHVRTVFAQGWPATDSNVVKDEVLEGYVDGMADALKSVLGRLNKRLHWALEQLSRLDAVRHRKGTLDPEEDALRNRCDRLVKKLKGISRKKRREAEGYDDTYTYSVLAAEGFLPGYGLDSGSVVGFHLAPPFASDIRNWELRRSQSLALHEYIPGNLIYANGHRFLPRFFHLEPIEPLLFQVASAQEAIREVGTATDGATSTLAAAALKAVPICDVDLPHNSHITDEEDYRFQIGTAVYGYEQARHESGRSFTWGPKSITYRGGVYLRLVNVGVANQVRMGNGMGYPVCRICGQSRSPLASQADLDQFTKDHQERCGAAVENIGFYADIVADAICLQDCADREEAYSVMEALRKGAAHVLEMEIDDLQILAIGRPGDEKLDILLYDPMPGGSGLLEEMLTRWGEVVAAALEFVRECPAECERACVDCLLRFRNAFFHRYLDRKLAAERLVDWGADLSFSHDILPKLPKEPDTEMPVNDAAKALVTMLERAGFHSFKNEFPIPLGRPFGTTTPDIFFEDPSGAREGICIYLDGMSKHIHGNPRTQRRDREIRDELRGRAYEVIEIPYGHLSDLDAMRRHFYRLGRLLLGKGKADEIRGSSDWFES